MCAGVWPCYAGSRWRRRRRRGSREQLTVAWFRRRPRRLQHVTSSHTLQLHTSGTHYQQTSAIAPLIAADSTLARPTPAHTRRMVRATQFVVDFTRASTALSRLVSRGRYPRSTISSRSLSSATPSRSWLPSLSLCCALWRWLSGK